MNPFKTIAARYKAWRQKRLDKERKEAMWRIRKRFYIEERHGRLWIVCDGVAFHLVHPLCKSSKLNDALERYRKNNLMFEGYEQIPEVTEEQK